MQMQMQIKYKYLMVRLADLRPSHLIECHVSGHFLAKKTTKEGEVMTR